MSELEMIKKVFNLLNTAVTEEQFVKAVELAKQLIPELSTEIELETNVLDQGMQFLKFLKMFLEDQAQVA